MDTFNSVMSTIGSVLLAILILLVMVTVHEFGHYLAGKALKFKINEFAIGFGPKLFSRASKRTGEIFSLRMLPLGGFCAFAGEDEEDDSPNAFNNKSPWKRIIVLVAGPLMNYLLALLLIIISLFAFGQMAYKVGSVAPPPEDGANASQYIEYSLKEGDVILQAEGKNIYLTTDLMSALSGKKAGDTAQIVVLRGGAEQTVKVMLRGDCNFSASQEVSKLWNALGVGTYGVTTGEGGEEKTTYYYDLGAQSVKYGFFATIGRSFEYSFRIAGTIFKVLGELLTGRLGLEAMGGPVTTIKLTSQIASRSAQNFFEIAAYIGVNLAIFNLLPIPALDGSKVIFCLIEWIFRKPVPRKVEAIIHAVGFFAILGFAILVDILQFV